MTVRVALQTPIPSGPFEVFDSKPMLPERAVDKPVSGPITHIMAESKAIYSEPLVSELDCRLPPAVVLVDPRSLSLAEKEEMKQFPPTSDFDENNDSFNENGYRLRELAQEVNFGSEFSLYKFGIIERMEFYPTKEVSIRGQYGVQKRRHVPIFYQHPGDQVTSCTWYRTISRAKWRFS